MSYAVLVYCDDSESGVYAAGLVLIQIGFCSRYVSSDFVRRNRFFGRSELISASRLNFNEKDSRFAIFKRLNFEQFMHEFHKVIFCFLPD